MCTSCSLTITDNAQHARQWAGGCGTAAPGDIQDTPPTDTAWGAGQSEGGRAAHPRRGGDPSAKRPKRHRQAPVSRGQAFKRGRGHADPPPPPAKRARVEQHDAARHGRAGTEVT